MILQRLQQFLVLVIILSLAYLVTVRAVMTWVQVSPQQVIALAKNVGNTHIDYQLLSIEQTWQGAEIRLEDFNLRNHHVALKIDRASFDFDFFSLLSPSSAIGRHLSIDGFTFKQQANKFNETAQSDSIETQAQKINQVDFHRFWKQIRIKNAKFEWENHPGWALQVNFFDAFRADTIKLASQIAINKQNVQQTTIHLKSIVSTNLLGQLERFHASVDMLQAAKIGVFKNLLTPAWQAALPEGELLLGSEIHYQKDETIELDLQVDGQSLAWHEDLQAFPTSMGASIRWSGSTDTFFRKANEQTSWLGKISNLRLNNELVAQQSPIRFKGMPDDELIIKTALISAKPFSKMLNAYLISHGIENPNALTEVDIADFTLLMNLKDAEVEQFSFKLPKFYLPEIESIPEFSTQNVSFVKDETGLRVSFEQPIQIKSDKLGFEPIELSFKQPVLMDVETSVSQIYWALDSAEFLVNQQPITLTGEGDFSGNVELDGQLNFAKIQQLKALLPYKLMPSELQTWLKNALVAGNNIQADLRLRGDLNHFPFKSKEEGVLNITAHVENTRLQFDKKWPTLKEFDAKIVFEPFRLDISSAKAKILDIDLRDIVVVIDQLDQKDIAVVLNGQGQSAASEGLRFLQESPIAEKLGVANFIKEDVRLTGTISADIEEIWIPVNGYKTREETVKGKIEFEQNQLVLFDEITIDKIKGELAFTESDVAGKAITGLFKEGLVKADVATLDQSVKIFLTAETPLEQFDFIEGVSNWHADLSFPVKQQKPIEMLYQFEHMKAKSLLPAPFDQTWLAQQKNAIEARLTIDQEDAFIADIRLPEQVFINAKGHFPSKEISLLDVSLGQQNATKINQGSQITGSIHRLNVDSWLDIYKKFSENRSEETQKNWVWPKNNWQASEVLVKDFVLLNNHFANTRLTWQNLLRDQGMAFSAKNENTLDFQLIEKQDHYVAKLSQLELNTTNWDQQYQSSCSDAEEFALPSVLFSSENLVIDGKKIDQLDFNILTINDVIQIDNFKAIVSQIGGEMTGRYAFDLDKHISSLDIAISSKNVEALSDFLDIQKGFTGKQASVSGGLQWQGSLQCFDTHDLDGRLDFSVKDGMIKDADPGFARLLGLLSIESLARRLEMRMADVTTKGLVYDEIKGQGNLQKGVVELKDFRLNAPSADVELFGQINLVDRTIDSDVRITPAVGSSIPVIAALTGAAAPITSLAAYILLKAVPAINEDLVTYRYEVTGSMEDPNIKDKGLGLEIINAEKADKEQEDILDRD